MNTAKVLYLSTKGDNFITLPETLEVEGYHLAVVELNGKFQKDLNISKPLYLCSDFTQDVIVNNRSLPVLRQFKLKVNGVIVSNLNQKIWLNVTRRSISHVRLFICDADGNTLSFGDKGLYCTLLLIPHRKWLM